MGLNNDELVIHNFHNGFNVHINGNYNTLTDMDNSKVISILSLVLFTSVFNCI